MYKAIKDSKIIAINNTGDFPCLVYDEVIEDTEHSISDYVLCDSEYVLTIDDKAKAQQKQIRVKELKQLLADTDWVASKITDLTILKPTGYEEEIARYTEILEQRAEYRAEIEELEN